MATLDEAVRDFLAQRRIAVVGVSRSSGEAANFVYRKLRAAGYQVFAVNPSAEEVEGDACFPDLGSVPGGVDGVVVATHPRVTGDVVQECSRLGIRRIWMHRSFGQGSVSDEAVRLARQNGLTVIPGACPAMFCEPDIGHRCMRWILKLTGKLPGSVALAGLLLLAPIGYGGCALHLRDYTCAPDEAATRVDPIELWQCNRDVMARIVKGKDFSLREFWRAAEFFEELTDVRADSGETSAGRVPGRNLASSLKQWDAWYETHGDGLRWDPDTSKLTLDES